jgi:GT2 family glycosyltransferase
MKLAIIIINWNASEDSIACMRSIAGWNDISASVYIVDNNSSTTDKKRLAEQGRQARIIFNSYNAGFAGGNNIGIKAALKEGHDAVILMNNDARINEIDLKQLIRTMNRYPEIGVIGPLLYGEGTHELQNAGGKDIGWHYFSQLKTIPAKEYPYDVDYVSGTIFMARVHIFDKIGFLDERYFFSGEIADFCKRIKMYSQKGEERLRVAIDPKASGVHDLGISSHHRETLYTYYTVRNRFLYIRKFLILYVPILYPYWVWMHMKHAMACHKAGRNDIVRIIMKGVMHGLRGRFGPI